MKYLFTTLLLVFIVIQSQAQEIITDRPDQTESSATVGKGNLQIETGLEISYHGIRNQSTRNLSLPTSLFRLGLLNKLELRVGTELWTAKYFEGGGAQGIGNLEIGFKYEVFTNENEGTQLAFMSHAILPTGTPYRPSFNIVSSNRIAFSQELNERLAMGLNLGYDFETLETGDITYSMVLVYRVNDKVGVYVEGYGQRNYWMGMELNTDAGFTYLVKENLQLDFSFGIGEFTNYFATGVSWRIDRN